MAASYRRSVVAVSADTEAGARDTERTESALRLRLCRSLLPVVNRKLAMETPTANDKVSFAANAAIASTMIVSLVAAVILVTW